MSPAGELARARVLALEVVELSRQERFGRHRRTANRATTLTAAQPAR
jgi:hypothetical protein